LASYTTRRITNPVASAGRRMHDMIARCLRQVLMGIAS
jgi:hypothetical protein